MADYATQKAARAAKRAAWDNDPSMQNMNQDMTDQMKSAVKPIEEPKPAPRPMLPNYYRRGGAVKKGSFTVPAMCKGGKVISSYGR